MAVTTWVAAVRVEVDPLVAEEHERPDFAGMLTCRDPQWEELFELCRHNDWEPVFDPVAPSGRNEIVEKRGDDRMLMLLFAGELAKTRLMYRVDERREGPLAAAIGWARVALCDASLGDLAAAASDLQRAVALSARVGAYHTGAAAAIGDAAFALTFVRDHGWERLARETDAMVGARRLAVLELGLRDRGAKIDVPQRRRVELIRAAAPQQPQKRELRDPPRLAADRRVGHRPVDRKTEIAPQPLERLFVLPGQRLAELDKIRPRH